MLGTRRNGVPAFQLIVLTLRRDQCDGNSSRGPEPFPALTGKILLQMIEVVPHILDGVCKRGRVE